jgi:hypothetical protein
MKMNALLHGISRVILSHSTVDAEITSGILRWTEYGVTRREKLTDLKNAVFYDVTPCGTYKKILSEELIASMIRVKRISEIK